MFIAANGDIFAKLVFANQADLLAWPAYQLGFAGQAKRLVKMVDGQPVS